MQSSVLYIVKFLRLYNDQTSITLLFITHDVIEHTPLRGKFHGKYRHFMPFYQRKWTFLAFLKPNLFKIVTFAINYAVKISIICYNMNGFFLKQCKEIPIKFLVLTYMHRRHVSTCNLHTIALSLLPVGKGLSDCIFANH